MPALEHFDVAPLDGYDPEIGLLLATLDDSTREWQENLGTPPQEALAWSPFPRGPSMGAVMLHMADCELFWFEQFVGGKPADKELEKLLMTEETDQENVVWPTPPDEPWQWYLDVHRQVVTRAREHLGGEPPDRIVHGQRNSYTVRWIVAHVAEHDAYHGGQLVLLHEAWKRR